MSLTAAGVGPVLRRVEQSLLNTPVLEAVIARREIGLEEPDDEEATADLAEELVSMQLPDGSWGSQVAGTATTLLLLGELTDLPKHPAADRGVRWLRTRQNAPGAFPSECDPSLHARSLCTHLAHGFYSPAASHAQLGGATLSDGLRFVTDRDARVGISSRALRSVMRWSDLNDEDRAQLDALARIADQAFKPGKQNVVGSAAALEAMATLAAGPRTALVMASLHSALSRLAETQRADGSFADLSAFHVLDVLLAATRAGYRSPAFDHAIDRAVHMLTCTQQANGSWGNDVSPYSTLIGWRALRHSMARLEPA